MGDSSRSHRRIDLPGSPNDWAGLIPAIAGIAILVALDVRLGSKVVVIGAFAAAPFFTALRGARLATIVVAILVVCVGAVSGSWNHNYGTADFTIRIGLLAAAAIYACYSSYLIAQSRQTSRRLGLLNEIGEIADGSLPLTTTVERITDLCVPELADLCMIDVITGDRIERVAVKAAEPRSAELEPRLAAREPSLPQHIIEGSGELLEPFFVEDATDERPEGDGAFARGPRAAALDRRTLLHDHRSLRPWPPDRSTDPDRRMVWAPVLAGRGAIRSRFVRQGRSRSRQRRSIH